jgi:DNA-directed RNA polymerase specialized sigma24 family protein
LQPDSERDLIPAWQDGNLSAARQIVAMHQSEAIYVSYLLTGEHDQAIALAETGFLTLFNQSRTGDPDVEPRLLLLNLIAQSFLRGDYRERIRPDSGGLLLEPAPARFNVDDRRTLLLAALGRLDSRERAILILRDFSGLATGEITRLQERRGEPLVAPMETARQRVRQSLDIPAGDPLRPAFVEATFSAPRTEIWSRIEHDVAAIQQRSRKQSRLISAAIIVVILAILAGGTLALLGGAKDGTSSNSAGSQPGQQPASLPAGPTVGQSIDRSQNLRPPCQSRRPAFHRGC